MEMYVRNLIKTNCSLLAGRLRGGGSGAGSIGRLVVATAQHHHDDEDGNVHPVLFNKGLLRGKRFDGAVSRGGRRGGRSSRRLLLRRLMVPGATKGSLGRNEQGRRCTANAFFDGQAK